MAKKSAKFRTGRQPHGLPQAGLESFVRSGNSASPPKLQVYYNRTRKLWSIRHRGRVIAHLDHLVLTGCTMWVSEKSRVKVCATQNRTVHAWISGTLGSNVSTTRRLTEIRYDPYVRGDFFSAAALTPVREAVLVSFESKGKCYAWLDGQLVQ